MSGRVKLSDNYQDREKYENMASLYACILTIEKVEKAYLKNSLDDKEYHNAIKKLIGKYKMLRTALKSDVPDVEKFQKEFRLNAPLATNRLAIGVSAVVEDGQDDGDHAKLVMDVTSQFITLMDSFDLKFNSIDDVLPSLQELYFSIGKCKVKNYDEHKAKLKRWLTTLNKMDASDTLDDGQTRQLGLDLEIAYKQFKECL